MPIEAADGPSSFGSGVVVEFGGIETTWPFTLGLDHFVCSVTSSAERLDGLTALPFPPRQFGRNEIYDYQSAIYRYLMNAQDDAITEEMIRNLVESLPKRPEWMDEVEYRCGLLTVRR